MSTAKRYRSIVIYDSGSEEKLPNKGFDAELTWFETAQAAQREAREADTGTVVGFIPLNLDDPEIQALVGVMRLAHLYDKTTSLPISGTISILLRDVFLAGRESVLKQQ